MAGECDRSCGAPAAASAKTPRQVRQSTRPLFPLLLRMKSHMDQQFHVHRTWRWTWWRTPQSDGHAAGFSSPCTDGAGAVRPGDVHRRCAVLTSMNVIIPRQSSKARRRFDFTSSRVWQCVLASPARCNHSDQIVNVLQSQQLSPPPAAMVRRRTARVVTASMGSLVSLHRPLPVTADVSCS